MLVEAHELGWVNAFEMHAHARREGYFSNLIDPTRADTYAQRFAATVEHIRATAGQPLRLKPHQYDPVPPCTCKLHVDGVLEVIASCLYHRPKAVEQ